MPDQKTKLSLDTIVMRNENVLSSTIDGQVVIISIDKGNYIGLEGSGNRIWALLASRIKIRLICDNLMDEYAVPADQCEQEVIVFMEKLEQNGLLARHEESVDT